MDKKEILKFEEDDASQTGINGKQVFFTKRINGKTVHNKEPDIKKNEEDVENEAKDDKEELFVEFKNITYNPNSIPQNISTFNKISQNKSKKNMPKKNSKKGKKKNTKANKNNRKKRKRSKTLKVIYLILIIIALFVFAFVSPIFNIDKFEIIGNEKINSETIISLSNISQGKNIFQISKKNAITGIKENPYINSVTVKKILPDTIQITVEERKVAYQVKVLNSYVFIDHQGYILEVSPKKANVPVIEGLFTDQDTLLNGKRVISEDLDYLNVILKIMESAKSYEINSLISKIKISNKQYILDLEKENKTVYLGYAKNLTNQMTYVKLIIENEKNNKGKIFVNGDISTGFKPYFREE